MAIFFSGYSLIAFLPLHGVKSCKNSFDSETGFSVLISAAFYLELQVYCWLTIISAIFRSISQEEITLTSRKNFHNFIYSWSTAAVLIGIIIYLEISDPSHFICQNSSCVKKITMVKYFYQCGILLTIVLMGIVWTGNLKYYLQYFNLTYQHRYGTRWATVLLATMTIGIFILKNERYSLKCTAVSWAPVMFYQHPAMLCYFSVFMGLILNKIITDKTIFNEPVFSPMRNELSILGGVGLILGALAGGIFNLKNEFSFIVQISERGCLNVERRFYVDWIAITTPIFYNICYFLFVGVNYLKSRRCCGVNRAPYGNASLKLLKKMKSSSYKDIQSLKDVKLTSTECLICLEEFSTVKNELCYLIEGCKHLFHMNCLQNWIKLDKMSCPTCRAVIKTN